MMGSRAKFLFGTAIAALFVVLFVVGIQLGHALSSLGGSQYPVWYAVPGAFAFALFATAIVGFVAWMLFGALWSPDRGFPVRETTRTAKRWPWCVGAILLALFGEIVLLALIPVTIALALLIPLVAFTIVVVGLLSGRLPKRMGELSATDSGG